MLPRKLRRVSACYAIGTTRVADGAPCFHGPESRESVWELLRASAAVPGLYGKTVNLGGEEHIDACGSISLADAVAHVRAMGAGRVICVDSSSPTPLSRAGEVLFRFELRHSPASVRRCVETYLARLRVCKRYAEEGVTVLRPRERILTSPLDRNQARLARAIRYGYQDMQRALRDGRLTG